MTFSALLTVATDTLISLTLIYCIVLERRIRAFRKQEQAFRSLMGDVAQSTRDAQGAVSSLRRLLDEVGHKAAKPKNALASEPTVLAEPRSTPSVPFAAYDNPVSALASRVAALHNKQAMG
jgi:hypothetical protein